MSDRRRPSHLHDGFALSHNFYEPSHFMQGSLPNAIRQGRHTGRALGAGHERVHQSSGRRGGMDLMPPSHSFFGGMDLMSPFSGNDMLLGSGFPNMNGMMQAMSMPQGNGVYQSSMTVMSSYVDEKGERKVERYKKAAYGNTAKDMHEVCEAYSNQEHDIMAHERRAQNKGIQIVKRRDGSTQVIEETHQPIGIEETDIDHFNQQWYNEFTPHFPQLAQSSRQQPRSIHHAQRRQLRQ